MSPRRTWSPAAAGDPPSPPDQVLGTALRTVYAEAADKDDPRALPRLVIQVWSETLRDEKLAASLLEGYNGLRQGWVHLVEAYRKDGLMRVDTDPDHVARTMIGMVVDGRQRYDRWRS